MRLNAVVLAGGKSSRMGQDKALLPFKGSSLAFYQYNKLKPFFKKIYLSAKSNKFDFNANIIYDKSNIFSPLSAIYSILNKLKEDIFIIAVDMPLVKSSTIKKLIEAYLKNKNYDIYAFSIENKLEPTVAIYRYNKHILTKLEQMINSNNHKLSDLIISLNSYIIKLDNKDEFINLNYYSEYLKVR